MIEAGLGWWIETAGFQQLAGQTFASLPPSLEFGLHARKREFGKVQLEEFEYAYQNKSKTVPPTLFTEVY